MPVPLDIEMTVEVLADQLAYFLKFHDPVLWIKFCQIKGPERRYILNRISWRVVLVLVDAVENVTRDRVEVNGDTSPKFQTT